MVYKIFNILHECGMSNISIFSGDILNLDYIIISNGTSIKHIKTTSFKIIKYFKSKYMTSVSVAGVNSDWIVVDGDSILVHLMLLKSRNFYDLDSLYIGQVEKIVIF